MLAQGTISILLLSLFALLFQTCISEYELESNRTAGILAINGRITNGVGPHYVTLTRTSAKDRISEAESGAEMQLLDDLGNAYPLFQEEPGVYVLPKGSAHIFPGYAYRLIVELRGQVYETPFQTMRERSAEDSVSYSVEDITQINEFGNEVVTRVYNVYLDSQFENTGAPQYFKWEASEVYVIDTKDQLEDCYRDEKIDPQRINIHEAEGGIQVLATQELIGRRPFNDAFWVKYYTVVDQYNISEEEYDYWQKVKKGIEQAGSIFDIPPGRIRGNITNVTTPEEIVYGYFSVALKTTTRFSLVRKDFPEPPERVCQNRSLFELPGFCQCRRGIIEPDFFWQE